MNSFKSTKRLLLIIVATFLVVNISKADMWDRPKTKDFYSPDSSYFVRIVPTFLPKKYPAWYQSSRKKRRKFSPQDTTIIPCHAIMYKRVDGKDSLVWRETLINTIAPVSALVSNNGKYLATFDNWGSVGFGINVFVIYGQQGGMLKRYNLEEISPFPINTYVRSITTIAWKCGVEFIDNSNLNICFHDKGYKVLYKNYSLTELKIN